MQTFSEVDQKMSDGEFQSPRWSVITADECAASGLTYDEAARLLKQLTASTHGLCIVTDEAAKRLYKNEKRNGNQHELAAPQTFAEQL